MTDIADGKHGGVITDAYQGTLWGMNGGSNGTLGTSTRDFGIVLKIALDGHEERKAVALAAGAREYNDVVLTDIGSMHNAVFKTMFEDIRELVGRGVEVEIEDYQLKSWRVLDCTP